MVQQPSSPPRDHGDDPQGTVGTVRPRSRARRALVLGVLPVVLLTTAGVVGFRWFGAGPTTSYAVSADRRAGHDASPTATAASTQPTVGRSPSASPSASPSPTAVEIPATGPGTFVTARADGSVVGHGSEPIRYTVQIEKGIGISPVRAANEIDDILADPRGWTANGVSSFRLVSSAPYDLRIRIATPGTTDSLCWHGIHQDTEGEYDCEVPGGVVVNLKRWVEGSPTFDGPIQDYRALIINHEMGHALGHGHETCPGPGKKAPVMMQQIKGLKGCVANAWPYDRNGHYVSGPPAR